MIYTQFGVCSKKGDFRKNNEDRGSVAVNKDGYVLGIVCDGMGGHYGGETAARLTIEKIKKSFLTHTFQNETGAEVQKWAHDMFLQIANDLEYFAKQDEKYHEMGTTCVMTLIMKNQIYFLNVGDSRAYFVSKNFTNRITEDQNLRNALMREKGMTAEEAEKFPNSHALVSCIGPLKEYVVDLYSIGITTGSIVLCSDGVYGVVNDFELKTICIRPLSAIEKAEEIVKLALIKKSRDNATCVVVEVFNQGN